MDPCEDAGRMLMVSSRSVCLYSSSLRSGTMLTMALAVSSRAMISDSVPSSRYRGENLPARGTRVRG